MYKGQLGGNRIRQEVDALKKKRKLLILCLVIPLVVGGLAALVTRGSMNAYSDMKQPPLAPPGWVFPVVWTILFVLMGVASYLVLTSGKEKTDIARALRLYGLQLAVNFFWSVLFFNLTLCWAAFVWLILLWGLVLLTLLRFFRISKAAGWLLIPYLIWVTFAGYLNFAICAIN